MRPHGSAIRALREAHSLSLRALQDATDIDRRLLARIEAGEVDELSEERAEALADALDAPITAITRGEEDVTAEAIEFPLSVVENDEDDELKRYTPEQVHAKQWLPWSPRKIRELAYAREIYAHRDGGRITLTREDVRRTSALGAIEPFQGPAT